jgi:hypothetical protein
MLTVGLTPPQTAGFGSIILSCASTPTIEGFPNCNANIANSGITVSAADGSNATSYSGASVLFDSGTPSMILAPPNGVTIPAATGTDVLAADEKVLVSLPNGYEFSYAAAPNGVDETVLNTSGAGRNVVGIDFFQNHDFYIDYTASTEGWH